MFAGRISLGLESADNGPVDPSDSDRRLSHPSHLRTQSRDHAIQPSFLVEESDPAARGDSYIVETSNTAQTRGFTPAYL